MKNCSPFFSYECKFLLIGQKNSIAAGEIKWMLWIEFYRIPIALSFY